MKWVRKNRIAFLTGLSPKAVDEKRYNGVWLQGVHWKKGPDGMNWYNCEAIEAWVEGRVEFTPGKRVSA